MTEKSNFDWLSFLLGLFFVILAVISFQDPLGNLVSLVLIFALFLLIKGFYYIFIRRQIKELTGYRSIIPIVIGIADILIGIYLFFNLEIGVSVLPYVFSIWFIVDSLLNLFITDIARAVSKEFFWLYTCVNVLGLVIGFILFVNPLTAALTLSFLVGYYLLLFGVLEIVYSFR